jgi:hypothetical protein
VNGTLISAAQCDSVGGEIPAWQLLGVEESDCTNLVGEAKIEFAKDAPSEIASYQIMALQIAARLIVYPIAIFVLFAGSILLLNRMLALAFVLILGPLAFLFFVLPKTRAYWSQWWDALFKWSFFLPAFMFFFWLGYKIRVKIPDGYFIVQGVSGDRINIMNAAGIYILCAAFFIGALIVSNKFGIAGASMVTGWGRTLSKKAGGLAKGYGKIGAGAAAGALLSTGVGQRLASSKWTRWANRPLEAITAAGQKVKGQKEDAALKRRQLAAKASPQYRAAIMRGMGETERADFVRGMKDHELEQTMGAMTPAQQGELHRQMKKFKLDDKVLDAIKDFTTAMEALSGLDRTNAGFQNGTNAWLKGASREELQKRISADDIRNNSHLQEAIRSSADLEDLRFIVNAPDKAVAIGDWFIDLVNVQQQVQNRVAQGMSRAQAMRDVDVINRASQFMNPQLSQQLATSPLRINIENGLPMGRKTGPAVVVIPGAPPPPPPTP